MFVDEKGVPYALRYISFYLNSLKCCQYTEYAMYSYICNFHNIYAMTMLMFFSDIACECATLVSCRNAMVPSS